MTDKMREAFEKWYLMLPIAHKSHIVRISNGHYFGAHTETAWQAWQAAQSAAVPVVGDVEALICDDCGAETNDPWHDSKGTNRHYHRCDPCNSITAAELDALRRDAERYRWLRDGNSIQIFGVHESWTTSHRLDAVIDAAIVGEMNHG